MRIWNRNIINYIRSSCKSITRSYSNNPENVTEKLTERSLLCVTGKDASALLQGLVTNDVSHLSDLGFGCLYALFLNNKGRVLYDSIIYKIPESDCFYVEVDKSVAGTVQKHLNIYRLRKDAKIDNLDDKYQIWVHFNLDSIPKDPKEKIEYTDENLAPCMAPKGADSAIVKEIKKSKILQFGDPRISLLGSRIIAPIGCENEIYASYSKQSDSKYKLFRYRLGIGEGVSDLPPGNCFPLEANCDYLHGVSFHKGCYLGQELTARTYHTGVIRKRYMPLFFDTDVTEMPKKDETVKAGDKNVGKLRGYERNLGLGLLRIAEVIDSKCLLVNNLSAYTVRPLWWPSDKEKVDSSAVRL